MTNKKELLLDLVENPISRRSFAKRIGMIGAGIAGASMLSGTLVNAVAQSTTGTNATTANSYSDADILNFALNLEYLEGEFYTFATNGDGLVQEGVIPANAVTGPTYGGHKVPNIANSPIAYIASEIRRDEQGHVRFLRSALGSAAVKKPTINLNALGIGFSDWKSFIILAAIFEDVGTSAYNGAAPLIQSKTYLAAAAGIYGVEAQHSGALRTHAIDFGIRVPNADGKSVPPLPNSPFFVNNALTPARSAQEVLNIVYGGHPTPGGFFPNG
ncbi:MAG: ferritin-like domain-containing protein, partial [Acidobacteriaceae bacterium]